MAERLADPGDRSRCQPGDAGLGADGAAEGEGEQEGDDGLPEAAHVIPAGGTDLVEDLLEGVELLGRPSPAPDEKPSHQADDHGEDGHVRGGAGDSPDEALERLLSAEEHQHEHAHDETDERGEQGDSRERPEESTLLDGLVGGFPDGRRGLVVCVRLPTGAIVTHARIPFRRDFVVKHDTSRSARASVGRTIREGLLSDDKIDRRRYA